MADDMDTSETLVLVTRAPTAQADVDLVRAWAVDAPDRVAQALERIIKAAERADG